MIVTLYKNFNKKINSTKRPTGGTEHTARFKQSTSLADPTILIEGVDLDVNYAKMHGRYYFVDNIIMSINNIYELHLIPDVLATYKSNITGYTGFVEYAESVHNKWIPDTRLTMSSDVVTTNKGVVVCPESGGTIILTVAGVDSTAQVGFTCAYAISNSNANALANWLYDESLITQLKKLFTDPYKAIIEAHYVPFNIPTTGTTIKIGDDDSHIVAHGLTTSIDVYGNVYSVEIPWKYNDFRDYAPYSVMQLYLPYYGTITIDQNKLKGAETLDIRVTKDPISGEINYFCTCSTGWQGVYKVDVAVPLAIGQTSGQKPMAIGEVAGGIGSLITAGVSVASAPATGGASLGLGSALAVGGGITALGMGAMTYFSDETSGHGGNGGFASINNVIQSAVGSTARQIRLSLYTHLLSTSAPSDVNSICGRPYFDTVNLGTLSGYVKCSGASVSLVGLGGEREAVNGWLNSGIYIE